MDKIQPGSNLNEDIDASLSSGGPESTRIRLEGFRQQLTGILGAMAMTLPGAVNAQEASQPSNISHMGSAYGLSADMFQTSPNAAPGHRIYSCNPGHVERGECTGVDESYYETLAVLSGNAGIYEIALMRYNLDGEDQTAIGYNGGIGFGSAQALEEAINSHPEVSTVIINSDGGVITEAAQMAEVIQSRGLNTWTIGPWSCLSACPQVLLAGENIRLDGAIGFHSSTLQLGQLGASPEVVEVFGISIERYRDFILASLRLYEASGAENYADLLEASLENMEITSFSEGYDLGGYSGIFERAIGEYNGILVQELRLFERLGVNDPVALMQAIFDADGDFIVFDSVEELVNFSSDSYRVMTAEEVDALVDGRRTPGFQYQGRETIISTLG